MCAAIPRRNPSVLRRVGTYTSWPIASPIRRWPIAARCATIASIDATSSFEMYGASMSGRYPFTSTIGSACSSSRAYRARSELALACRPLTKMIPATPRSSSISM